jgi:hypothetical protein
VRKRHRTSGGDDDPRKVTDMILTELYYLFKTFFVGMLGGVMVWTFFFILERIKR